MGRTFHLCSCLLCLALVAGCSTQKGEVLLSPKASASHAQTRAARQKVWLKRTSEPSQEQIAAAHARFASAVILEMNGETEAALESYLQAAHNDPDNEWLILEVSRRLIQQRKLEQAQEILERAVAGTEPSSAVLARLAMLYSQLGKHDLAVQTSRTAIKRSPASLSAYQGLFFNFLHAGRGPEALKTLDEAKASVSKPSAEFLVGLSELYSAYSMQYPANREAIRTKTLVVLRQARDLEPSDPALKLRIADGLNAAGGAADAAKLYEDLLKHVPDIATLRNAIHAKLANIYLQASDRESARDQLEALILSDPTNPQPYFFLGHLAEDERKLSEAADYFRKTIILNPDFDQAYFELANVQLAMDKPADALTTIEKAKKKFSTSYFTEFASAIAYSRLKEYEKALSHFTAAEVMGNASNPPRVNHFFYFQLGITFEQQGNFTEAARAFEKCLSLSPDFDEAMNYLGYMWAERGENLDRALQLLLKAVAREPQNAAYLDSLGWAYFKLNRLEEALENIRKAVEFSEEPDATLQEHLGDVLFAIGRAEQAREAWSRALKIEPKESLKEKLGKPAKSSAK